MIEIEMEIGSLLPPSTLLRAYQPPRGRGKAAMRLTDS